MNQLLPLEKPVQIMDGSLFLRIAGRTAFGRLIYRRMLGISDEGRVSITKFIENKISPKLAVAATRMRSLSVGLYLDDRPAAKEADELVEILVEINQMMDQLACHYAGPKAEIENLLPALTELARMTACYHQIRCHFQQIGPAPVLPADQIPHLYRIASDSVSLARRRGANMILIRLETLPRWLCLDVIDNSTISKAQTQEALEILSFRGHLVGARVNMGILPDGRCLTHSQLRQG